MPTDLLVIDEEPYSWPRTTHSPSGRYAIAWGVPGMTGTARLLQNGKLDTSKVRNYLVERRTLSIVGTLPLHSRRCRRWDGKVGEYKSGGNHFPSRNHSLLGAFWNRSEDWVLVWHEGDWWYEALYLGHRTAAGFHFIEIGDRVEDAVRAEMHRRHPRVYDQARKIDQRKPWVDISNARVVPPMLSIDVGGGLKNEESPLDLRGRITLHFTGTARSIQARITSLQLK